MKGQKAAQIAEVETLHRVIELDVIEDYRVAIDGGAHVGTWSALMAVHFRRVIAFEPNPPTYEMLAGNTKDLGNVEARCQALMQRAGHVTVFPPRPNKVLTGWQVKPDADGASDGVAIDDFELDHCGLIKLDLEGAELLALRGAEKTIRRCRPVLVVEFCGLSSRFGHSDRMIQGHLISAGYRELFRSGPDRVFVPN